MTEEERGAVRTEEENIMNWEEKVKRMVPYVPGEQPKRKDIIKLNTNECPYPPAPAVKKALQEFDYDSLRLYPDPDCSILVEALAKRFHKKPGQIFVGVGSDDVLAMAFMTFFQSGEKILFPEISYSFYDVWAKLYDIPFEMVPLKEDFSICADDYCKPNGGVVIANPNAPTGLATGLSDIEKIVAANPDSVVIVDEAYVDFGGESAVDLVEKYENLLVVQTYSKSRSLAGLRVGYAIGSEKLIKYMLDVKFSFNSYTLNRLALEVGTASLADEEYFRETCGKIVATRERVKGELKDLDFTFPDSSTNFIFAKPAGITAKELFEALKKEGIYVRFFDKPVLREYLRISIGTDEEMNRLLAAIREIVGK